MDIKRYPPELPPPLRENYGFQHVSPFARTGMSTGRARQRRVFQSVPSSVPLRWLLTEPQAQVFEAWFAYDITDGTDWFDVTLRSPLGRRLPCVCRFMEMYSGPELVGRNMWRYRAQVEVRERPILPPLWWEYGREFLAGSSIIDKAANREWPQ